MQEYTFLPYDKRFPGMFAREKAKLQKILPFAKDIEHFGSTAVPGLGGKGVIDIYILIPKNKVELTKKKLVEARYPFHHTEQMIGGIRMVFRKKYQRAGITKKVHIHVGTVGITDFESVITFRDTLRKNEKLCREYEKVKKLAVKKTKNSGEDSQENARIYVEAKGSFIKSSI